MANSETLPKIVNKDDNSYIHCSDGSISKLSFFEVMCYNAGIYTLKFLETAHEGQTQDCKSGY